MAAFFNWLDQNWFSLLQSVGIIGSFLLAGAAYRRDSKARETSDRLILLEQHRELWRSLVTDPALARIRDTHPDLISKPITIPEREFLNLATAHFSTGWALSTLKSSVDRDALTIDAASFFSLPLPNRIWQETKSNRDTAFVRFIERALKKDQRSWWQFWVR